MLTKNWTIFYKKIKKQTYSDYLSTIAEKIDHETVIKLGCLEMRRYFKHMPGNVFDKKSNFELLE